MNLNLIVRIRLSYFCKGRSNNANCVCGLRTTHLRRQSGRFKLDDLREIWLSGLTNFRTFQLNFVNKNRMLNTENPGFGNKGIIRLDITVGHGGARSILEASNSSRTKDLPVYLRFLTFSSVLQRKYLDNTSNHVTTMPTLFNSLSTKPTFRDLDLRYLRSRARKVILVECKIIQ
jgi:hypothetical protein